MDKSVIEKIVEMRDESVRLERDGLTFAREGLKPVFFEPRPAPLDINTLTGLVDYLNKNVDSLNPEELMIRVLNVKTVALTSKICGKDRARDQFVIAGIDKELQEYPFGRYMAIEEFVIRLRSMFEGTPDLERVIAYTSNLASGTAILTQDDGISQTATVKIGVSGALKKTETAPVIVHLKPFRTFRELEQMESEFLFRIQTDEDGKNPSCALFEADGGRWRNETVLAIKEWLKKNTKDIAIIA